MNCPHCNHALPLASIPDADLQSEVGRRRVAKRVNDRGGRPSKPTKCPRCAEILPSRFQRGLCRRTGDGRQGSDYAHQWGRNGAFKVHEISLLSWGTGVSRAGMYEIGFRGKRGVTNAKATITEADLLALRDMIDAALEGR